MSLVSRLSYTVALGVLVGFAAQAAVTISPDHPELLQQGILDAYAARQTSVAIPAGVYAVPVLPSRRHLDWENLKNFEIDARGAIFVFQDVTSVGLYLSNCDGLYFHGATMYYATAPFSQGVIQAVAADRSFIDIQIEKGYPTNLDDPKYFTSQLQMHLFDAATRLWKRNAYGDVSGSRTQRLGPDTFRIFTSLFGSAAVGDLIGIRVGTGDHTLRVVACSRTTVADLTILNSPNFGIAESLGGALGANHFSGITVKRGNRPPGAVTDPLFSTTADGFHSTEARTGPVVDNCHFESMPDDGIAVHGHYSWVMQTSGNTLIVSNTLVESKTNFSPGDPLRLLDTKNQPAGEAVDVSVTPLPGYQNSRKSGRTPTYRDFTTGPYYQITLDQPLTADFDYLAANPNASGAGFVLRNNTILNHRARGLNLKADNGTVEGNVIDGSTMAGIRVGPEFFWSESGFSRNLVLRNNTIRNVAFWGNQAAAMLISPEPAPLPSRGYQNLTIEGNTFENFDITAIFISSADGVTIRNNLFRNVDNARPFAIYSLGQDVLPGILVYISRSDHVQVEGNTLSQIGTFNSGFVETASANVQDVASFAVLAGSTSDFSDTQGANNWYYGYFPSGKLDAFTQLPAYDAQQQRWQHTTFGPPWTLLGTNSSFHPNGTNDGPEEWAVRRWVSPVSGAIRIVGHLAKLDTNAAGTGVYGRIYVNGKQIYDHFLPATDGVGTDYAVTTTVSQGDTVDFAVAPNRVDSYDRTQFSAGIFATTEPVVTSVSNAASGQAGVAAGAYISIYGANFVAPGFLDDWSKSISADRLPTTLDGVSVTIGGQPTYIVALAPNQINVLAPSMSPGAAPVVVTTPGGPSVPFPTTVQAQQPAFFLWPAGQAVATHVDYSYAVKDGTFGVSTVAAKPGEVIILWGTGFGPATPAAPDGQIVPPEIHSLGNVAVTVGGQQATVVAAVLAPGLAGVDQIAIQLPAAITDGDYPIIATVDGLNSPPGTLLTVKR